jgi:hypothetical protein
MFQAGLVDQEEVLKLVEWPDWENVMKRVMLKQSTGQLQMPGAGQARAGGGEVKVGKGGAALKLG